jgi:hypothetical protein
MSNGRAHPRDKQRMSKPYQPPQVMYQPRQESVLGRGRASDLAKSQPQRALEIARTIPDGWYRCQAMATIAREANDLGIVDTAFKEARIAAAAGDDAYQRAAVLAFAIVAAMKRSRIELAKAMLHDALALIPSVEPTASRAYALDGLWRTTSAVGDHAMREAVLAAVQAQVHPDRSWRARVLYRDIAANLAWDRPGLADAFVRAMPAGKARDYVARRRAEGQRQRLF